MKNELKIDNITISGDKYILETDVINNKYDYANKRIKQHMEELKDKKQHIQKIMSRCKLCKCYCGCHPCKHTK